ncbi:MAG: hypothetical protein ACK5HA_21205 [Planctomycetaceae bacterium]
MKQIAAGHRDEVTDRSSMEGEADHVPPPVPVESDLLGIPPAD